MGSKFFTNKMPGNVSGSSNMQSRAVGASSFAAKAAGTAAQKDLGQAAAYKTKPFGAVKNSAASNAKGPKT